VSEPIWLDEGDLFAIHEEQLRAHGGDAGVLNPDRVASAAARPRNMYAYLPDTPTEELAAALAVGLAKGHGFVDGNKRTACVAALTFLELNGLEIIAADPELADVFIAVADGTLSQAELTEWLLENSMRLD
jgi:death-on-curing protein